MGGGQSLKKYGTKEEKEDLTSVSAEEEQNSRQKGRQVRASSLVRISGNKNIHPSLRYHSGRFESTSSLPIGFNGAVILDSGTGESKVMYVVEDAQGEVVVTELKKLPGLKGIEENPNRDRILQDYEDSMKDALRVKMGAVAIAGFTAWFRALSEGEKGPTRSFFNTRLPEVVVEELQGFEEGMFEAAAVNYAAEKTGIGRPNLQLAAGGGSINMVLDYEPFNIECGFRKGMKMLMDEGLKAIQDCENEISCNVTKFKNEFPDAFKNPVKGTIIAISACFYAAKSAGLVRNEAVMASEVTRTFAKRKKVLMESVVEVDGRIADKKIAQEISNVVIQSTVFRMLLHPEAKVYFRRDWNIKGTSFRTTWTAGYFIKYFLRKDHEIFYPWEESENSPGPLDKLDIVGGGPSPMSKGKKGILSTDRRNSQRHHKSFTSFAAIEGNNWGTGLDDGCGTVLDDGTEIKELDSAGSK